MSGWYYFKSGFIEDERVGPISDEEFLKLAFEGKLKPDARGYPPKAHQRTNGQQLAQIPLLLVRSTKTAKTLVSKRRPKRRPKSKLREMSNESTMKNLSDRAS